MDVRTRRRPITVDLYYEVRKHVVRGSESAVCGIHEVGEAVGAGESTDVAVIAGSLVNEARAEESPSRWSIPVV